MDLRKDTRSRKRSAIIYENVNSSRSEKILSVRCDEKLAFLPMEFEPRKIPGTSGLYMSRTRVNPNALGYINVSVLNVTNKDLTIAPRTRIGKLTKTNEIIPAKKP